MTVRACECGSWSDDRGESTGCTATTKRLFSQGHDARLAAWLARHQATGQLVRRGDGTPVTPAEAATQIGLRYDIPAKAARLSSRGPETEPADATIQIGRWDYNATIAPTGEAHYTRRDGQTKTAAAGTYKIVHPTRSGE